jgi:hypothetical protein
MDDNRRGPYRRGLTTTQAWALGIAVLALIAVVAYLRLTPGADTVRDAARATAAELERTPLRGGYDVTAALTRAAPRTSGLTVTPAGRDNHGDRYEITGGGDHPACLTVRADAGATFPTVTVADGRCVRGALD